MSTINYNYAANAAANVINRNEKIMDQTMAKLSSGLNIGVGHNEPGKLGTFTRLKAEGTTARAGLGSLNDALSRMKLVESVAMSMSGMLTRMQELAAKAADANLGQPDREALDAEFSGIILEWTRLGTDTKFNGLPVMTGVAQTIYTGNTDISIKMDDFRLESSVGGGNLIATGAVGAGSANSGGGASNAMSVTTVAFITIVPFHTQETINQPGRAVLSLAKLAVMIPHFSGAVGRVGALVSRLEFSADAQAGKAVAYENSASVVGDTDYAIETAKLASTQVISQAATAILAQANARSSTVLTLLK